MSTLAPSERPARGSRLNQGLTVIALVMVLLAALATLQSAFALRGSVAELQLAEASIAKTQSMLATFGKTESFGLRWLISLREDYFDRYNADMLRLDVELAELHQLSAGDLASQDIVARLQEVAGKRRAFNDATVALALAEGIETTVERIRSGGGADFGDEVRTLAESLVRQQRQQRDLASERLRNQRVQAAATVLAISAIAAALAVVAFAATRRERRLIRAAAESELARTRAETASREKSLFLANMSHEIRTPMNAIFGFSQLLARKVSDPQLQEYVSIIRTSGQSLLALINDILDLSRIEAGRMELNPEPTDVEDLVHSTVAVFVEPAEQGGLRIEVHSAEQLPMLCIDPHRLRQVLGNLIGNAVKYSEVGTITVRCGGEAVAEGQHRLWLEVEDQGPGVGDSVRARLFEPFIRDGSAERSGKEGSGLGLSIVRRLVELMEGSIVLLRSDARGSCFRIEFAQLEVAGEAATANEHEALPDFSVFAGRRVLVVDDIAWNRQLVGAYLDGAGVIVEEAGDGEQALDALRRQRPDLVLMDLRMPVMDGYAACAAIRRIAGRALPVVALSASGPESQGEHAAARFDAHLRKPIAATALYACLLQCLPAAASATTPSMPQESDTLSTDASVEAKAMPAAQAGELRERVVETARTLRLSEVRRLAFDLDAVAAQGIQPTLGVSSRRLVQYVAQFDLSGIERELDLLQQLLAEIADGR